MIWRLVRKLARLYALVAIGVLGFILLSDKITSHQLSGDEAMLALFFPYGVLASLVASFLFMRLGGWMTVLSAGGFYLASYGQAGIWPTTQLPMIIAGAAPLFLLAGSLKSLGNPRKKRKKQQKKSHP